jgi:hypothetical protein
MAMAMLSSAGAFAAMMAAGKLKPADEEALGPFIAGSAAAYLIFPQEIAGVLWG